MTILSCDIVGPSAGALDQNISGRYAVEYSILTKPIESQGQPVRYLGPRSMISEAQTQLSPTLNVQLPKKWSIYDYTATLGAAEVDIGSFLQRMEYNVLYDSSSPGRRDLWSVICYYDRLQPGMFPRVDSNGDELQDPVQWPPEYKRSKITIGDEITGGWPRDSINGGTKYGPFSTNSIADPGLPGGTLSPIGTTGRRPITTANNLPPSNFVRVNVDIPVIVCRMYFDTLERFNLEDQSAQNTVFNGGDAWDANGGANPTPQTFFDVPWGFAKYQGGDVIGARMVDNGLVYYLCEFRYELDSLKDIVRVENSAVPGTVFDATAGKQVVVRNESNITGTDAATHKAITLADINGNIVGTNQPFPLGLDGERQANDEQNFIRYWYAPGHDYGIMTNGVHEVGYDWPDTQRTTPPVP